MNRSEGTTWIESSVCHPLQEEVGRRVVSAIGPESECDLDTLVSRCEGLSWNQVFLVVDHMSRQGVIRLTRSTDGRYRVGVTKAALYLMSRENDAW
jgi:hypothetical protein